MSGIIKKVEVTQQVQEAAPETTNESEGSAWYWDEGVPGTGERPEWLKSKYGKVVDQAKAYLDAEKKIGSEPSAAPEDYEWGDYQELFDVENPHLADLKNKAKELRLSQEAFKTILDPFAAYHKSLIPDTDAEIEKLGPNADAKINTVNQWASNHLSDDSLETLGRISQTADVFKLMDEIRQLHYQTQSKVPTNVSVGKAEIISAEQVQNEITENYDRYKSDSNYRRELNQKLKQAHGED